jgi:hypothetical protein
MTEVKETKDPTQTDQKSKVMPKVPIWISQVAREDLRTITPAEISNANTVIRPICHIPLFIHIWSKNIPRVLMESKEIHPPVVEAEVDQERILIKDLIQEPKISSRLQKEKVDQ